MPDRRTFLRNAALVGAGLVAAPAQAWPTVLTARRTRRRTAQGTLAFRPYFVQEGRGPHLNPFAYATDAKWDTFHSNITAGDTGVFISDTEGEERFGINVQWNVEGMGYLFITADNGGEMYQLPPDGQTLEFNLNYELAHSRVARNRQRWQQHTADGLVPSRELQAFHDLSEGYLEDARKAADERQKAELAQQALKYAMWAGEKLELEYAQHRILRQGQRPDFFSGCDARAFYQMRTPELFMDLFTEVFNYATITYVWTHDGVIGDFERTEGDYNYEFRDAIFRRMRANNVTVEGRPVVWFHTWVTPDWIKNKSYDQLLSYVEKHTREVVSHYGDDMYAWEIVNEFHDWANEALLTPEQTVELTKLACEVAKDTAPNVHRLINHCCPFAEYVQMKEWSGQPALYPQRTPWEFTRDLVDAGVDFTLIGQQMYFPGRDLQDIFMLVERFEQFNKPIQLSEVGTTSGPSERSVKLDTVPLPEGPYEWYRYWDEDLQADWVEALWTYGYSRPGIEAVNWFDFVDPHFYIENGGLIRNPEGEPKAAYHRLKHLREQWAALPVR